MSNSSDDDFASDVERGEVESRIVDVAPLLPQSLLDEPDASPQYSSALQVYFVEKKKEITDSLADVEGVTIRDLAATSTLIVTAERAKWAGLIGKGGPLDIEGLRIHENRLVHRAE